MEEIWKPVKGYEGLYEASNLGRIRSVDHLDTFTTQHGEIITRMVKGKILKQHIDSRGYYLMVTMSKRGKRSCNLVHRVIAKTFIDNPSNLPEVNHKDEDKANNSVENLEWCDHRYNNNYGSKQTWFLGENNPGYKFPIDVVIAIRNEYDQKNKDGTVTALSKKYGVSTTHVSNIVNRKRWGWLE